MKIIKILWKCIKLCTVASLFLIFILYGYAYFKPKLDIKNANQFYIYDDNEQLVYQGSGNNEWVSLDDISPYFIDAILYTEDKNFYKHNGFDFFRIGKAIFNNLKSK